MTSCARARTSWRAAVAAIARVPEVILPFPGGTVRSGSKVGARYKGMIASTNHRYCPTLKGRVADSALPAEVGSVLEIVIDGLSESAVARATVEGVWAVCTCGRAAGVIAVDAGNYGGKLGPYHFHLHRLLGLAPEPAPA